MRKLIKITDYPYFEKGQQAFVSKCNILRPRLETTPEAALAKDYQKDPNAKVELQYTKIKFPGATVEFVEV